MQILIIVDDAGKQSALKKQIARHEHAFHTSDSGESTIDAIVDMHIDVVICSHELPDMPGSELAQRIRRLELDRYLYIAMILDSDQNIALDEILINDVDALLTWPLEKRGMATTLLTAERIICLESETTQKYRAIHQNFDQTVEAFSSLIETFNSKLGAHCRRVSTLALSLAEMHPDISPEDYRLIEVSARLHDIGMIGLPQTVVEKRGTELSGDEKELYRSHPKRGADILDCIDTFRPAARLVRMHHEQFGGRGFPYALSGDAIPLESAIVGAASLYDDLIHRECIDREVVHDHLQRYRGYQLAPSMVDRLLELNLVMQQADALKVENHCDVADLKTGMVLSRDIVSKSGACVMSAGTQLDILMISKLKRYHESGNIIDSAFIKR